MPRSRRSSSGPGRSPAMRTPSTTVSTGRSLGWISLKKPSLPIGSLSVPTSSSFATRDHARHEHHEVDRDGQLLATGQEVARGDDQAAVAARRDGGRARRPGTGGRPSRPCATRCRASRTCRTSACPGRDGTAGPSGRGSTPGSRRARLPCSRTSSSTRWPRCRRPAGGCPRSRRRPRSGPAARGRSAGPTSAVEQLLVLGQREHALDAVAELPDLRLVGVETGGDDDRAHEDLDRLRRPARRPVMSTT